MLEQRAVNALERVDADDGIDLPIDLARNDGDDTAPRANVELGRLRAEGITRNTGWISNYYAKRTGGARSPHASVLGAEGATAGARWNLGWLGFPQQLESDISAVAASGDEQERPLFVRCDA
jgi:hypothetical protein